MEAAVESWGYNPSRAYYKISQSLEECDQCKQNSSTAAERHASQNNMWILIQRLAAWDTLGDLMIWHFMGYWSVSQHNDEAVMIIHHSRYTMGHFDYGVEVHRHFIHLCLNFQTLEHNWVPHKLYRKRVGVPEEKQDGKVPLKKRKVMIQHLTEKQEGEGRLMKKIITIQQLRYYSKLGMGCSDRRICIYIYIYNRSLSFMMTPLQGITSRITCALWREPIGHRWFSSQKAV